MNMNIIVTSSQDPVANATHAKCAICLGIVPARRASIHRIKCEEQNPDLVPPFRCAGASGHMFHTAFELERHERSCPCLAEIRESLLGPPRPVVTGNVRAPTPTNLIPDEQWTDEDLIETDRSFELPPVRDDEYDAYTAKAVHALATEFSDDCPIRK